MVSLVELNRMTVEQLKSFDVRSILPELKNVSAGSVEDVMDTPGTCYYQWLACLLRVMKPKQIVELGGAMGTSALVMLSQMAEDQKLFTITLEEHGLEYSFIKTNYPNLTKVIGDDLDLSLWPKDLDWSKTDLVFIDSLHTGEHLQKELDLYLPLLPKGCVVLLDDVHINDGMWETWLNIKQDKMYLGRLHWSGFGLFVV